MNGVIRSSGAQRTCPATATSGAGCSACHARCSETSSGTGIVSLSVNSSTGARASRQPVLRFADSPGARPVRLRTG